MLPITATLFKVRHCIFRPHGRFESIHNEIYAVQPTLQSIDVVA